MSPKASMWRATASVFFIGTGQHAVSTPRHVFIVVATRARLLACGRFPPVVTLSLISDDLFYCTSATPVYVPAPFDDYQLDESSDADGNVLLTGEQLAQGGNGCSDTNPARTQI